ncbi:hypothetical protein [Clostridium sporogenes]|uniref:hypothetical protein n=1 Tax=Clostridium sporogenes TaxID=1509 RepID=UPI0013D49966|nr:hypothetical protein [Clostridium sporogenes]NFD94661.1 hypothetical protein [Clostridium sporogenes]NFE45248.1 hypothetical protein [Clostridium sporogenes]NFF16701.1 hypothetical protein [Clostridium sporogenes]NFF74051.1 hypothetical protein [Clostridium sporogenes]NFF79052.1 hypothetical protein [Clostridium sporogenes]
MADGCKLEMQGLDEAMKKLKEFTPKLKAALALDAQNIAMNMEKWAKENVIWTDRTAHARLFLTSTVKWTNTNTLMVALSHQVDYGVYLELCNEGKYAILERAIQEFTPQFMEGWKKIVQSAGVI